MTGWEIPEFNMGQIGGFEPWTALGSMLNGVKPPVGETWRCVMWVDITIKHNLDVLLTGQRPAGLQSFNVCYKWGCICWPTERESAPKIFHGNIWNCVRRGHAWKFAQVSEMWQLFLQRETYVGGWESTTTKYFDVQITDRFDQPHEPFWSRECSLKFGSGKFEGFSAVNSPGFFRSTCRLCFHLMDNLVIFWSFLIEHRDFPWPGHGQMIHFSTWGAVTSWGGFAPSPLLSLRFGSSLREISKVISSPKHRRVRQPWLEVDYQVENSYNN